MVRVYEEALRKRPRDQVKELSLKLAAAYLELGQIEAAKKVIDQYAAAKPGMAAPVGPSPPKEAPPYKLIVSAPKSLLDQVGNGKMTFEEFAKRASIETVTLGK